MGRAGRRPRHGGVGGRGAAGSRGGAQAPAQRVLQGDGCRGGRGARRRRAAGLEEWMRAHLEQELASADAALVDRLEQGSIRHARRRAAEMAAAGALLCELGVPALVTSASEQWLRILERSGGVGPSV
ncbi:MAG: DUF1932 domain-containing protein [Acidimicrobiales bacterium]